MKCSIITEGESDVALLKQILKPALASFPEQLTIIAAGGWSGADSLARSILAVRDEEAVVVFADADSNDVQGIERRQRFLEDSLSQFGSPSRWKVILVAPELVALLFQNKKLLEELLQTPVSQEEFIRGKYEPKRVLQEKLKEAQTHLIPFFTHRFPEAALDSMREISVIQELRSFIHSKLEPVSAINGVRSHRRSRERVFAS